MFVACHLDLVERSLDVARHDIGVACHLDLVVCHLDRFPLFVISTKRSAWRDLDSSITVGMTVMARNDTTVGMTGGRSE